MQFAHNSDSAVSVIFPRNKIASVANLTQYSNNARTHSDAQIAQIAASIQQFGWTNPVLVDEQDVLIAGHGRLAAARQLGMDAVPAIVIEGLDDAQKRALRLADNKLALNASWSDDLLRTELSELRDVGFDLALTGFGDMELGQLFAPDTDPAAEWQGMPEYDQQGEQAGGTRISFRALTVHFHDAAAVEAFAALVGQTLTQQTKMIWFPQQERHVWQDKRYATTDEPDPSDLHPIERAA